MWRFVLIVLSIAPCIFCQDLDPIRALFEGRQFTSAQATAAESAIQANPDDWQDRVRLLGYYARQLSSNNDTAQAARVQQILWLIEHHPELSVLRSPDAAIPFPSGTASTAGIDDAKQAWRQALATHSDDARVLANAAWFFRITDKDQSIELLRRAVLINPRDQMLADQLGREYAVALLGVTALDPSGRAVRFDPVEANSALAQTARSELQHSSQAAVLYAAGSLLTEHRTDVMNSGRAEDPGAFGASLIERAKALTPNSFPTRIRVYPERASTQQPNLRY
jgi:hypothetical protein